MDLIEAIKSGDIDAVICRKEQLEKKHYDQALACLIDREDESSENTFREMLTTECEARESFKSSLSQDQLREVILSISSYGALRDFIRIFGVSAKDMRALLRNGETNLLEKIAEKFEGKTQGDKQNTYKQFCLEIAKFIQSDLDLQFSKDLPMHTAVLEHDFDLVKFLLSVDPHSVHKHDMSLNACDIAASCVIFSFLEHKKFSGSDILSVIKIVTEIFNSIEDRDKEAFYVIDKSGCNILHYLFMVQNVTTAMVKVLVNYGAIINYQNHEGNTALHIAIKVGNKELMIALLQAGASFSIKNKKGETAQDLVKDKDDLAIAFNNNKPKENDVAFMAMCGMMGLKLNMKDDNGEELPSLEEVLRSIYAGAGITVGDPEEQSENQDDSSDDDDDQDGGGVAENAAGEADDSLMLSDESQSSNAKNVSSSNIFFSSQPIIIDLSLTEKKDSNATKEEKEYYNSLDELEQSLSDRNADVKYNKADAPYYVDLEIVYTQENTGMKILGQESYVNSLPVINS